MTGGSPSSAAERTVFSQSGWPIPGSRHGNKRWRKAADPFRSGGESKAAAVPRGSRAVGAGAFVDDLAQCGFIQRLPLADMNLTVHAQDRRHAADQMDVAGPAGAAPSRILSSVQPIVLSSPHSRRKSLQRRPVPALQAAQLFLRASAWRGQAPGNAESFAAGARQPQLPTGRYPVRTRRNGHPGPLPPRGGYGPAPGSAGDSIARSRAASKGTSQSASSSCALSKQ